MENNESSMKNCKQTTPQHPLDGHHLQPHYLDYRRVHKQPQGKKSEESRHENQAVEEISNLMHTQTKTISYQSSHHFFNSIIRSYLLYGYLNHTFQVLHTLDLFTQMATKHSSSSQSNMLCFKKKKHVMLFHVTS